MTRSVLASVATVALVVSACTQAVAAPPQPGALERFKQDGSYAERVAFQKALGNDRYAPELVERAKWKIQNAALEAQGVPQATIDGMAPAPPGNPGMPSTGTVKIPAVLIEFSDLRPAAINTQSFVHNSIFGTGVPANAPYESLSAYYRRSSFNQLDVQGNTLGWYRTAYPRSAVQTTTAGRENLIKEALASYNASHDFAQYDNDNDGDIDYLLVIYAGPHTDWGSFWWAYQTGWSDPSFTIDGKRIGTYVFQFTDYDSTGPFLPRVAIHETGHALGLPDLYDYDEAVGPSGGVGGIDMMDGNRGDHNGFHKWLLNWSAPQVVGSEGLVDKEFRAAATTGDGAVVMKGADAEDAFSEFFFVENRTPAGNDDASDWPGSGLMIWHVDSTLNAAGTSFANNNSYTEHKLLRVVEADGLEEIEQELGGDSEDFWQTGQTFGPTTSPSSARYDGRPSGVDVFGIETIGSSIWAYLTISNEPPTVDPIAAQTIECNGEHNVVTLVATVHDPDGDPLTVEWQVDGVLRKSTANVGSGTSTSFQYDFPHGESVVSVLVSDGSAPAQQQSTTVTVEDTTDPIVTVVQNYFIPTDKGVNYASRVRLPAPQVNDACDGAPTLTSDLPARLAIGEYIATWTVRDFSGNTSRARQKLYVVDEEKPKVIATRSVTKSVDRGEIFSTYRLPAPKTSDNSGKKLTLKSDEPKRYPVGTTVVTWTATDTFGNKARASSRVTVVNGRPTADAGRNKTVNTDSEAGAAVRLSAAGSSDPDGHDLTYRWQAKRVKFSSRTAKSPKATFPVGQTKVSLTVTDEAGASHTNYLYVTVRLKRSAGPRSLGADANKAFESASSTALDDIAQGSVGEAALNGYRYAAAAEGYGVAAGEVVRWEEGQSVSDATTKYLELRRIQAMYGEAAMSALIRSYAESGVETALDAALHAARGVQSSRGDLVAP